MAIVVVLLVTVLLRFALILVLVYVLLPARRDCPRCAAGLSLIRHPLWRRLVPLLEHRWCLDCGWNGIVRRTPALVRHSRVITRAARS